VVASKDLPGTCKAEHIHEEEDMHMEMPIILSSFITSMPRRPSIIIQHSYEPTHSEKQAEDTGEADGVVENRHIRKSLHRHKKPVKALVDGRKPHRA
jgi:hypothetical protein